jgi:uncharacterized membrane protein
MIQIIEQYGIYAYAIVILFGGLWGVNYFPAKVATKYKFGLFSLLFAILFVVIELSVSKNFQAESATKYLLTYTVVTSCYELFLKGMFKKWGIMQGDEPKENL